LVADVNKLNLLAIMLTVVAFACGRTELDSGFGTQNTTVAGAPDSGAGATANVGGRGTGGTLGAAGRSGAGGRSGAAGSGSGSVGTTGTVGGFNGTIRFCSSDLDCGAGTPLCCPVGAVKVCEPGPCASNGDSDNDDDSAEGHRR
jgi:hypothetical protein